MISRLATDPRRRSLEAIQTEKLRQLMETLHRSAFYRQKFREAGVDFTTIEQLDDLLRLPFTLKSELLAAQSADPPYGGLPSVPLVEFRYLHRTSGTSGRPLHWLDDRAGWETWLRCWAEVYRGAGVGRDDVVFFAFSFGPYVAHWSALDGARALGGLALPGAGMSTADRLHAIVDHGATVVVSTPTYALHLAEVAASIGIDLSGSGVRITLHAGEPGASVPEVKKRIEKAWGARCYDHIGATEVGAWGYSCGEPGTAVHLNEDEFLFEWIDGESGAAVPDGEPGELVITTLARHAMPVVRYRTGDVAVRSAQPCGCGRVHALIDGGVIGRIDDMLIVRGVNVYPSAIDNLVRSLPAVVEYEVEVRRNGALDELHLAIELDSSAEFDEVRQSLAVALRSGLGLRAQISEAEAGSLPRYELKARRFRRL